MALPIPPDPGAVAPAAAIVDFPTRSGYGGIVTKIVAAEKDQSRQASLPYYSRGSISRVKREGGSPDGVEMAAPRLLVGGGKHWSLPECQNGHNPSKKSH